jgi:23S rRNA (uracil1939-C5)-methyltransferase
LGYHPLKSHEVLPFNQCWIIPNTVDELAHWLGKTLPLKTGIESIQVRINQSEQILVTFQGKDLILPKIQSILLEFCRTFPNITGVVTLYGGGEETALFGLPFLIETLEGRQFHITPHSFFQVNRDVTLRMLHFLESQFVETYDSLLDLYSGVGTFGIWLKDKFREIVAVEESAEAVLNAKNNLILNHCPEIECLQGDALRVLQKMERTFAVAIVDPPRAGCDSKVLSWLCQQISEKIVYISCDPTTLARDLKQLSAAGWQIKIVQPFDMFPQTYHIETLVILEK